MKCDYRESKDDPGTCNEKATSRVGLAPYGTPRFVCPAHRAVLVKLYEDQGAKPYGNGWWR